MNKKKFLEYQLKFYQEQYEVLLGLSAAYKDKAIELSDRCRHVESDLHELAEKRRKR
jgi:hypothetical protein